MRMRLRSLALAAMLMLALLAFAACDANGDDDAADAPSAPAAAPAADEPAASSEEDDSDEPAPQREPLAVVASIYPLGFFTERIGGDLAEVEYLVSPGFENHGFVPTASDLRLLEEADLVVMNGLGLEPWMERALETLSDNPDRVVVEAVDESLAIEGFAHDDHHEDEDEHHEDEDEHGHEDEDDHGHEDEDEHGHEDEDEHHEDEDEHGHEDEDEHHEDEDEHGHEDEDEHGHEDEDEHGHEMDEHGHDHGGLDPHMWLDPILAAVQVERILDAFIQVDPDNADAYRANASALAGELDELDHEIEDGLAVCHHDHFVTSHAAYGYLAERYGIEQIPVAGLSPEIEPSPRELAAISDLIAELGLEHVMVEPVLSGELTRALASEHDIDLIPIHAIESVTQAELDDHDDYFGLMRDNLASLVVSLDCA